MSIKITTQEELNNFLYNYKPSKEKVEIEILDGEIFSFDSKGKDVSNIFIKKYGIIK